MPRVKRKTDESDGRVWSIPGARIGTAFHTTAGKFVNGTRTRPSILDALRAIGYQPEVTEDTLPADRSEQDRADIAAANRMLGLDTLEDGRKRIDAEIDKGMRDFTRRLKKSTYVQ